MKIRWNVVLGGALYALIASVVLGFVALALLPGGLSGGIIAGLVAFAAAVIVFYANCRLRRRPVTRLEAFLASLYAWLLFCLFFYGVYPLSTYHQFLVKDAVFLMKVFGISFPISILAGEIGYRFGGKKTARSFADGSRPARGRIAIAIPLIIMVLVSAFALRSGYQGEKAPKRGQTKSALKNLASAQESYYADHNTYSLNLSDFSQYGWISDPDITINIITANTTSWSATARHDASGVTFSYSSAGGGLQ